MMTSSKTYQRICNHYSPVLETRVGGCITCDPLQLSESYYLLRGLHLLMVLELTFNCSTSRNTFIFNNH